MTDIKELVSWVENLGGGMGIQAFVTPATGDYLMFQGQGNIPLHLSLDPIEGAICAASQVAGTWSESVHAAAPRLRSGESLEIEIRFSTDGAEIWLAGELLLHFPMSVPPNSITKIFGTESFTYAGAKEISSPAPDNHGRIVNSLQRIKQRLRSAKLIYDVGMGDASDTDFYLQKGFSVVAVEPNATAVALAARRFKMNLANGSLILLNMAVAHEINRYPYFLNQTVPSWSSLNHEIAARKYEVIELHTPVVPLSKIIQTCGAPYFIKCSTEGYDAVALSSLSDDGTLPQYVSAVITPEVIKKLTELGYSKMKLISQSSIPLLRSPKPAKEGVAIDFRFGPTSNGLFGSETPGVWLSGVSAQKAINSYLDRSNLKSGADQEQMLLHAAR
jgi:FkbM family methyltransferase